MANYKWPNVYTKITDLSGVVATNSVTSCAYVGEAEFGPINTPTFLSSLRNYTSIFGALNAAKYGYAGYSLAVASESIDSHYFVRVVKAGKEGAHEADDAKYAALGIAAKGNPTAKESTGYYVEEIDNVLTTEDATGLFTYQNYYVKTIALTAGGTGYAVDDELLLPLDITAAKVKVTSIGDNGIITGFELISEGAASKTYADSLVNPVTASGGSAGATGATFTIQLSNLNLNDALMVVANNPNNLNLSVRLTDSTINENRAYLFKKIEYTLVSDNVYTAVITGVNSEVFKELAVGSTIEISRVLYTVQGGLYIVNAFDADAHTITFTYTAPYDSESQVITPTNLDTGKVSNYPNPDHRTFQVDVYATSGRVITKVETYQFCTTYQAKDNYGDSTFVEDVINGSSNYIKIYTNPFLLDTLEEDEVLEVTLAEKTDSGISLKGGQSGGKPASKDLNAGWDAFKDRTQTNVSLLMNSGYSNASDTSYQEKMLEIAEKRRDCFCLFDIPMSQTDADNAIDWRKNVLGMTTYRGALSSPWVRTYDSVQGRAGFIMCPSAFIAKLIGQAGDPWNAPAGPNRGIIGSSTVSPTGLTQSYDSEIGGVLYADNQINCIVRDTAAGYVNWGQRTLQAKPSALDRINVARTVIYIETILRDAARWHLFENNTPYERMQITLQFSQFLDTILAANGIAAYKVICDNSNNTPIVIQNNQLVIDVIITPVYAAESIILNTTVTGADADVTVSSSAD